jgi:hypothetical protein
MSDKKPFLVQKVLKKVQNYGKDIAKLKNKKFLGGFYDTERGNGICKRA